MVKTATLRQTLPVCQLKHLEGALRQAVACPIIIMRQGAMNHCHSMQCSHQHLVQGQDLEAAIEAGEGLLADEVEKHNASCAVVRPVMEGRHIRVGLAIAEQ